LYAPNEIVTLPSQRESQTEVPGRTGKSGGLSVIQPDRFEFVLNPKTVRACGLDTPPSRRAFADDVIE